MPTSRAFLGLDFGTTNASVSYLLDDPRLRGEKLLQARDVLFPVDPRSGLQSARVPTMLAADLHDREGKAALTGWDCHRSLRRAAARGRLLRHGQDFFCSVKSDLGQCAIYRRAFAPAFTTPEVVAGRILGDLLAEALAQLPGVGVEEVAVTLTVPSGLSEAARRATLDVAEIAGLERNQVELIDEPVAALIDLLSSPAAAGLLGGEPRTLALYDYGGGTLDVTIVRAQFDPESGTGLRVHTLAVSPYARLGGDVVDEAVMRRVVWPQYVESIGRTDADLTPDVRQQVKDTLTPWVARGLKESLCLQETRQRRNKRARVNDPLVARFLASDGESDGSSGLVDQTEFHLTGGQFEALLAPLIRWGGSSAMGRADLEHPVLLEPLVAALDVGNVDPSELDAIVLHGGGCRNPYVQDLLEGYVADAGGLFSDTTILRTPDLDTSVARGAAISGYWKHVRGETYIVPVTPEEIGVLTLSDRSVKLVDGGTPLPFPIDGGAAEVQTVFAVPAQGLRRMLVPFYAGRQRPCRLAGTIPVDLPPGLELGEEVRLRLSIDEDKTLRWWYAVGGGPYVEADPLLDPWTPAASTGAERRLLELRRELRVKLIQRGRLDPQDNLDEAGILLDLGRLEEAELLIDDDGEPYGPPAGRWQNLKALIWSRRGNKDMAHAHYLAALEHQPNNAVFLGNLGSCLHDLGREDEAVARCRAALGRAPGLFYVRLTLAEIHRASGDEGAAASELREGLRLAEDEAAERPGDASLLHWIALFRQELGAYAEAREAAHRAGAAEKDSLYGGDHTHRIAGPDSGYIHIGELP